MRARLVQRYDALTPSGGRLPKEVASDLQHSLQLQTDDFLVELLDVALRFARPEISSFRVGAIALGASGAIYFGANQEYRGTQLVQTIHAEQAAIINAYEHGEKAISKLAISAEPCGYCRQFIRELSFADELECLIGNETGISSLRLDELLPRSFGPRDLGGEQGFFDRKEHGIDHNGVGELSALATSAAKNSYAPYTGAFSGLAIETASGSYSGPYIENAAFNPSVAPLQSALVNLVLAGDTKESISRLLLVQRSDAPVDHSAHCRTFAASLGVEFLLESFHLP